MIRYRKLGYVELNVSDLDRSETFYRDIVGLQHVGKRADGAVLFRCDEDHHSVVLNRKDGGGLKSVGWMLESAGEFENLHRRLKDAGVPFERVSPGECDTRHIGPATRIVEPNTQATFEFYVPAKDDVAASFVPRHAKILQLGHVVFGTPQAKEARAFLRDVLNFRESDSIGEVIAFMRPFPNPFHHGIGIGQGAKRVLNHLNFMVSEIDDIGRAINRFKKHDVPVVWGPGKHPASSSVFLYFLEPDGVTLEYSFGMEEFSETDARPARAMTPGPDAIDTWGSFKDPRTGETGPLEAAVISPS
jgi:2,3-dihydroxy-p-cumate/2,3-dihydroxybenzoate 3,4-dioxygenase